jgi:hypothetical protein
VELGVFFLPAVVVMVRRGKDLFAPRMIRQASQRPRTHDAPRKGGVISLGDQEQVVLAVLDDHWSIIAKIAKGAQIAKIGGQFWQSWQCSRVRTKAEAF